MAHVSICQHTPHTLRVYNFHVQWCTVYMCVLCMSIGSSWALESPFPACVRMKTACTWPRMLGSRKDHSYDSEAR